MRKIILSVATFLLASQSFAHGWVVSRRTCLGGDRYQAWASLSEAKAIPTADGGFLVWMVVGYGPSGQPIYNWVYHSGPITDRVQIAKTRNVGCTRPKSTWCNHPKGIAYGYSATTLDLGGKSTYSSKVTYSALKAGTFNNIVIDTAKFNLLDLDGYSTSDIVADVNTGPNGNILIIDSLSGNLKIKSNSNYYSSYRIMVVKEDLTSSQEAIQQRENDYSNMIYNNVVAEGTITLTKSGIQTTGILNGLLGGQPTSANGDFIYEFKGINASISLDRSMLNANEDFAVITIVDGGFDFDQCKPTSFAKKTKEVLEKGNEQFMISPNPTSSNISIDLPTILIGENVNVRIIDMFGKSVKQLFSGQFSYASILKNVSVEDLPAGVYTISVQSDSHNYMQKLVIK